MNTRGGGLLSDFQSIFVTRQHVFVRFFSSTFTIVPQKQLKIFGNDTESNTDVFLKKTKMSGKSRITTYYYEKRRR